MTTTLRGESLKTELMDVLSMSDATSFAGMSESSRYQLMELLPKIEASNPTPSPATAALLEGEWQLKFVGGPSPGILNSPTREAALLLYAGGFSPADFALTVLDKLPRGFIRLEALTVTIGPNAPRCEGVAKVSIMDRDVTLRIKANLDVETGSRLAESWVEASADGLQAVAIPANLQYTRRRFVTYLDETVALLRDESGTPTILTREAPVVLPEIL